MGLLDLLRTERRDSVATLREAGPDGPTLCSGWTAEDVAAHLAIQDMGAGLPMVVLAPFGLASLRFGWRWVSRFAERAEQQADKEKDKGWGALLERLAVGPPAAVALPVFGATRFHENWIHHEDVRRPQTPTPRPTTPAVDDLLWRAVPFYAHYQSGLLGDHRMILRSPGRDDRSFGANGPGVTVSGPPGEIALVVVGRGAAADADVDGPADSVALLRDGSLRL